MAAPDPQPYLCQVFERIKNSWIGRSLLVNSGASLVDWLTVLTVLRLFHAPTPVGTVCGLIVGSTFSFLANRRFAFHSHSAAGPQLVRFALGMAALMALHAAVVGTLVDRMHVPLLYAKMGADLCIMATGQLLMFRLFVFAPPRAPAVLPAVAVPTRVA